MYHTESTIMTVDAAVIKCKQALTGNKESSLPGLIRFVVKTITNVLNMTFTHANGIFNIPKNIT